MGEFEVAIGAFEAWTGPTLMLTGNGWPGITVKAGIDLTVHANLAIEPLVKV